MAKKDRTKEFRFCGNKAGNPELARSGSQSDHRIRFILPARGGTVSRRKTQFHEPHSHVISLKDSTEQIKSGRLHVV